MLKYIAEEARYVEITGFKNANVAQPEQLLKTIRSHNENHVSIQFFNADLIATWQHLYFAVVNALMAFRTKRNISKNLAVEIMLYASAQRQIKKAIELIGVKNECANVAVAVVDENFRSVETAVASISEHLFRKPDEQVLEITPAKLKRIQSAFIITENELTIVQKDAYAENALVDLVIERMALLSTRL
jgi:KEOPS complex subunit Cgi121